MKVVGAVLCFDFEVLLNSDRGSFIYFSAPLETHLDGFDGSYQVPNSVASRPGLPVFPVLRFHGVTGFDTLTTYNLGSAAGSSGPPCTRRSGTPPVDT
jgi:hypothetical protein